MNGCPCPHAVSEHAPSVDFGQQICFVAGCDCNGKSEDVVTAYVQRSMAKRRVLHDLTDAVRIALEAGGGHTSDETAHVIAIDILRRFNVEAK